MFSLKNTRPVWAEINLDNLSHNMKEVKRVTKEGTLITAVVKADSYGHGAIIAAKTFLESGANRLAVATLTEGIELREAGIDVPILILGYTPGYQAEDVIKYDIIQAVYTIEQAEAISKVAGELEKEGKIHIKIDTGMSRIGFQPKKSSVDVIEKISKLPNIQVEGIFTHFALADEEDKGFTRTQYDRFQWIIKELEDKNIDIPIKHVSNSAAIMDIPEYNLDMVRAGIIIYGLYPSDDVNKQAMDLRPGMTLKTKISHVKEVNEDTGVSYGHAFVTDKKTKIGTLPIGYADGFTRLLSNKAEVAINGKRVPIIGRICMDQCMIDLTDIDDVNPGDEVVIFGEGDNNPSAEELASLLGTINYEILCMIGRRVPRVYVSEDEIVCIKDYILQK